MEENARIRTTADFREGVSSFLEKRTPLDGKVELAETHRRSTRKRAKRCGSARKNPAIANDRRRHNIMSCFSWYNASLRAIILSETRKTEAAAVASKRGLETRTFHERGALG